MTIKKKVYHQERQFIDPDHRVASTVRTSVVVSVHSWEKTPKHYLEAEIVLADCYNKPVTFSFGEDEQTPEALQNAVKKADNLISQFVAFRRALAVAISEFPLDKTPSCGIEARTIDSAPEVPTFHGEDGG